MARLPQPGSDQGTWGDVLNDYLRVAHMTDGSIRNGAVAEAQLASAVQVKLNQAGGSQGPTGANGPQGPAGPANTLTIGTVTSDVAPNATITGTAPAQTLNLVLAKGDQGAQGPTGANSTVAGPQGPAGADSTVAGPQGPQGVPGADSTVAGPQGPTGPANSLTIGTVTSDTTPGATITGTAPTQTLNLVLAKGDQGTQGPAGADSTVAGPQGPAGSNDWGDITNKPSIPVITASSTAPISPAVGDMWVDLSS